MPHHAKKSTSCNLNAPFLARSRPSAGFTIVELLVVIVVIGILATVAIVAYNGVQQKARDAGVMNDISVLSSAEAQYGVLNGTGGKDWYSTTGFDSNLNFRPSPGNVIDVVTNATVYCIRAYNPGAATYTTLATAATRESATGACTTLAASAAAIAASPYPVTTVADNFNRTAASLGLTSTNSVAWNALSGTWSTNGTRATTSNADSTNPLAVVDFTHADVDASVDISSAGGGDALIIRATDSTNYLRARYYHNSTYVSSGYWTSTGYWGGWVSADGASTPNQWSADGNGCGTTWASSPHPEFDTSTRQYTWSQIYPSQVAGTNCSSDSAWVAMYRDWVDTGNVWTDTSYYTYDYSVYIDKVVAGTATTLYSSNVGSVISKLRLTAIGSTITLYVNGSTTARTSLTQAFNQTATKHGIGRSTSGTYTTSAIDNFSLIQP